MLANEFEEIHIRGVVAEAPPQLLDETAQQLETELRNAPLAWPHQWGHQNGLARLLRHRPMQQSVDQNRPSGALSEEMPGRWQLPQPPLFENPVQHLLITQKTIDAGPLAARQAMPRQVEGQHRQPLPERPADQVSVQPHMVVIAMQQHQRAARRRWPPNLHRDIEAVHGDAPQMLLHLGTEVDTVIGSI